MSYTPTNWKAGDVVTSAKLNKMEQGIAASGGIRVVHLTMGDLPSGGGGLKSVSSSSSNMPSMQLDITPNELMDAFDNKEVVIIIANFGGVSQSLISNFYYDGTTYTVNVKDNLPLPPLTSSDPDEYFAYDSNSESSDDSGDGGVK